MATTKTKAATKKATTKGKTSKAATSKATRKATEKKSAETGESKRAAQKARDEKLTQQVLRAREAGTSYGEIAADLNITPGKAQFLVMLHRVAEGEVPRITGKTDEVLLNNIAKARAKADQYSSWGWLAARSGRSEAFIKNGLAEMGSYEPRAENIASARAQANGGSKADSKGTATKKSTAKSGGTAKKGGASAKATAARKRAAKKAGKSVDPS